MWKKCNNCQKRIKDENLKNEEELYSYFVNRIQKFLKSKNKIIIGWDEILDDDNINKDIIVQSWRGTK
jgi:hexosaminidase